MKTTSIRIPEEMDKKIKNYADRTGNSLNGSMQTLIDMGLKVVDSQIIVNVQNQ